MSLNESIVEFAALEWTGELGYAVGRVPPLAPGEPAAERDSFCDVHRSCLREPKRQLKSAIPFRTLATLLTKLLSGEFMVADFISGLSVAI